MEQSPLDITRMPRALEAEEDAGREMMLGVWCEYIATLDDEELQGTQTELQRKTSWVRLMHEATVVERIRRNPPNQAFAADYFYLGE